VKFIGGAGGGGRVVIVNSSDVTDTKSAPAADLAHCQFCRRRHQHATCTGCGRLVCALCSWSARHPEGSTVQVEQCRPCAGVSW
jgi:hypothetical protein